MYKSGQKVFKDFNLKLAEILKNGGVGVIPTDTIYGIVGSALNKKTVERIYRLRKRNLKKPMIILISSINDLKLFGISIDLKTKRILFKIWPNKVSVILPCESNKFSYLHRGANSLAFRFPKNKKLVSFIKKTGPLVAPSANWEGFLPAQNIKQARKYFGDKVDPVRSRPSLGGRSHSLKVRATSNGVDFYVDVGTKKSLPSTLIEIKNGKAVILREGIVEVAKNLV